MLRAFYHFQPGRRIDWRFQRVLDIVRRGKLFNRAEDDAQTGKACQFLRDWDRADTAAAREALFRQNRGLTFAYELHNDPSAQGTRFAIEARILAGQSDEEIAEQVATLPETIYWYEALFYCVRDRLQYPDFMLVTIKRDALRQADVRHAEALKHLAYFGGPVVANYALHAFGLGGCRSHFTTADEYYDRVQGLYLRLRALIASLEMQPGDFNSMQLLQMHSRLKAAEQKAAEVDDTPATLNALDGLLDELQRQVDRGRRGARQGRTNDAAAPPAAAARSGEAVSPANVLAMDALAQWPKQAAAHFRN